MSVDMLSFCDAINMQNVRTKYKTYSNVILAAMIICAFDCTLLRRHGSLLHNSPLNTSCCRQRNLRVTSSEIEKELRKNVIVEKNVWGDTFWHHVNTGYNSKVFRKRGIFSINDPLPESSIGINNSRNSDLVTFLRHSTSLQIRSYAYSLVVISVQLRLTSSLKLLSSLSLIFKTDSLYCSNSSSQVSRIILKSATLNASILSSMYSAENLFSCELTTIV
ncbi:hypothetical protein Bhyg_15333 [Pseudolycoriella hygida]|uniref:Uncharacterized protein n=1 Tax=Pseudolycoriella hygida TaxID=35572 RepID=A0A9Q0MTH4_9DIPT|nr:hypothetical protein Bhyg_15333 [Pseudolycoriella hygida]